MTTSPTLMIFSAAFGRTYIPPPLLPPCPPSLSLPNPKISYASFLSPHRMISYLVFLSVPFLQPKCIIYFFLDLHLQSNNNYYAELPHDGDLIITILALIVDDHPRCYKSKNTVQLTRISREIVARVHSTQTCKFLDMFASFWMS